jgi:pimeloyl-ACP methyl ester carboxylesterase
MAGGSVARRHGARARTLIRSALVVVVIALSAASPASAAKPGGGAPAFTPTDCPPDLAPAGVAVDCGYVVVPENRSKANSRTIRVAAAIVHATAALPKADPILFLNGGPAVPTIQPFAMQYYFAGAPYVVDRDVILVDTRGIGLSEPRLSCPDIATADRDSYFDRPIAYSELNTRLREAIVACRDRLTAHGIDLSAYNSAEGAADLDDIRRALGIAKWNLWAISADGVIGRTYMRLFPGSIRAAVLDSAQSVSFLGGYDHARGRLEVIEDVFAGCAADSACNAAYPGIRERFYDLVADLNADPIVVNTPGRRVPADGDSLFQAFADGIWPGNRFFGETITSEMLPAMWAVINGGVEDFIRQIESGDPPPLWDDADGSTGKWMTYFCRDIVSFITDADVAAAAADVPQRVPWMLSADFDIPVSRDGCQLLGVGSAAAAQHAPPTSSVPTLLTSGQFDTAVSPFVVRQNLASLSNVRYYEFPGAPHLQLASFTPASDCAWVIAASFLANPAKRPNDACFASQPAFDFSP